MSSTCGCCEGTEKLTPALTANRPGLDALSYRVGTHATFLETMKARLSSLTLDIPTGEFDPLGNALTQSILPLAGLTTRQASDPSIALLDSWALVADALTFYQERIANEGYLRTATERRSILELARLVGYTLRPGVAATVYLAYTIDEDRSVTPPQSIETVIEAGSRVQSVPGPGELPQSFETSDPLTARSDWNILGVRMTLPQITSRVFDAKAIYFQGTATNLKPNDALLIDYGGDEPEPVRVVEVTPDMVANRTRVTFRWWTSTDELVSQITTLAANAAEPAAFGVDVKTATAKRVIASLDELKQQTTPATTLKTLQGMTLPALTKEHSLAVENQFTKLSPWINNLMTRLDTAGQKLAVRTASTAASNSPARAAAVASNVSPNEQIPGLDKILDALQTSPSLPPPNAAALPRFPQRSFAAQADVFPRLLTTFSPSLKPILYPALENADVAPSSILNVYALRIKASLFGGISPKKITGVSDEKKAVQICGMDFRRLIARK